MGHDLQVVNTITGELVPFRDPVPAYMPVMSIQQVLDRREAIIKFVAAAMVEGHDYGVIPGSGGRKTLLKGGAEKLNTFFAFSPRFTITKEVEDWSGAEHGGQPLFYYRYRCQLWRDDYLLAEGEGSANSWEVKYRYRTGQRVCPQCGVAAIIKGKAEFGGGWLCFAKKGGCGTKFSAGDLAIESQDTGKTINTESPDLVNTLQKIAQKRALIGATLLAVNASEFFTQDMEDSAPIETGFVSDEEHASATQAQAQARPRAQRATATQKPAVEGLCPHCNAPADKPHLKSCKTLQEQPAQEQPVSNVIVPGPNGTVQRQGSDNKVAPVTQKPEEIADRAAVKAAAGEFRDLCVDLGIDTGYISETKGLRRIVNAIFPDYAGVPFNAWNVGHWNKLCEALIAYTDERFNADGTPNEKYVLLPGQESDPFADGEEATPTAA